jgi:hypothetical protein
VALRPVAGGAAAGGAGRRLSRKEGATYPQRHVDQADQYRHLDQRADRRGQGLFRVVLLHHPDDRIEENDRHDGAAVQPLAQHKGGQRRDNEDDHQELAKLVQEEPPEARTCALGQLARARLTQPGGSLGRPETMLQVCTQLLGHIFDR